MEYKIVPTRGYYSILKGSVFVSSADSYREARDDLDNLIRCERAAEYTKIKQEERKKKKRKRRWKKTILLNMGVSNIYHTIFNNIKTRL